MFNLFKSSNKEFEILRKKYKNKSAIILGNGPSLDNLNFELLKQQDQILTFATNRIAGICQINNWYPDIYSSFFCGPFTGKEYLTPDKKRINYSGSLEKGIDAQKDIEYIVKNRDTICFLHHWYKLFLQEQENVKFIKPVLWNRFKSFPKNAFSKYKIPNKFLWHNAVTSLFQICFYIGCKNIAIIGIDGYDINSEKNHFAHYEGHDMSKKNEKIRANKSIERLQEAVYIYAKRENINIFNLSESSIIKLYPKINLNEYLLVSNN